MIDRTPVARDQRPPIPAFAPVPRLTHRHDGWTPERQRAFIEALADTGSVSTAARMVNMASEGAYALRRHPQAGEFRRAWEAALEMGVQRLKDEAFERAINGQLVPVFVAGKLMGFRRKKNDRLLMFCLRHFGEHARRVNINYTTHRASAGASATLPNHLPEGPGEEQPRLPAPHSQALAHATTTTLTTTLTGPADDRMTHEDAAAHAVAAFEGLELDPQAHAEMLAVLEACAARRREHEAAPARDPHRAYVSVEEASGRYAGEFEPGIEIEEERAFRPEETDWSLLGNEPALAAIDSAIAAIQAEAALPEPERAALEQQRATEFGATRRRNNAPARPRPGPRPGPRLSPLPETARHHVLHGGPNAMQRLSARQATERCIEEARKEWIAAESEESWEAWKGGGG